MAAITLTLPDGYAFADGFAATLNGEDVQVSVSLGRAVITKVFPATAARVMTGIEVAQMPDKTAYDVGDSFDPAGMTVTAFYDDGTTEEVLSLGDISQKFSDFGWAAFDVADGNDVEAICSAVENAKSVVGKPKLIVLHTVKGKGCAAALDPSIPTNHNMPVSKELADETIAELLREK